jgi:hypothetical protein
MSYRAKVAHMFAIAWFVSWDNISTAFWVDRSENFDHICYEVCVVILAGCDVQTCGAASL